MSTSATSPRSLAEALRARDDASLAALLRARPDLITPVPTDLTQLATRAGTRASDVDARRTSCFDDEEIVEIIAHIALNLFTNYLNVALDVPVDFPGVKLTRAAA